MKMFARAPAIVSVKFTFSLVSSPFLNVGMPSIGTAYSVVGATVAATFSPTGALSGITDKPVGTELRNRTVVSASYAANAASVELINMKRDSGVVVVNVPTPFATWTGPSNVTAPVGST